MRNDDYQHSLKNIIYTIAIGPLYLLFFFKSYRRSMPKSIYIFYCYLAISLICFYLSLSLSYNPKWVAIIYFSVLLITLLVPSLYGRKKVKEKKKKPKSRIAYSGVQIYCWVFFLGFIFGNMSLLIQIMYYWLIGEYVTVFFSSQEYVSFIWSFIGMIIGYLYGIKKENNYISTSVSSLLKTSLVIFILITSYSLIIYVFGVYPLQRIIPISYKPQSTDILFYLIGFITITTLSYFIISRHVPYGVYRAIKVTGISIPIILIHIILLSAYSTTLNLTVASLFEGNGKTAKAKEIYAKAVPFISHSTLQAALIHRQGTLNVISNDYEDAISFFRKVVTDYSEKTAVSYGKAEKYIESFENNNPLTKTGNELLKIKYRTFEQAASCFPNSLSLILHFYETNPIKTRKLSDSIKEGFNDGTFIWKAESFLSKNSYTLLTTYWQTKETLISLLEAKYPVLIYVPGHVYTLYGYDERLEMFFTYDTAKYNRWDDKPFSEFQKSWMETSFLMSVVIKKEDEDTLREIAPELFNFSNQYKVWQKTQITDYYEQKGSYWRDYDQHTISERLGVAGLELDDPKLHSNGLHAYSWDMENWEKNIYPMLNHPWALKWPTFERFILYLLFNEQISNAKQLISIYRTNLDKESSPVSNRFLNIELATNIAAANDGNILSGGFLSTSDRLIGQAEKLTGKTKKGIEKFYWGYYVKGSHLLKQEDISGAIQLLLPLINSFDIKKHPLSKAFGKILEILYIAHNKEPALIEPGILKSLKIAWVIYNI